MFFIAIGATLLSGIELTKRYQPKWVRRKPVVEMIWVLGLACVFVGGVIVIFFPGIL
jgi:hypothetical protein